MYCRNYKLWISWLNLSKKRLFRIRVDSQHVKASHILAKSSRECFYHIFSLFSVKLIWKMSPLVLGQILGLLLDILGAYDKYPVQDCENLPLPIWKRKQLFGIFLLHFFHLHQILNILEEKMIVIANVFAILQTVKILLRPLSKKRCFGTGFYSQHLKASQILAK